MIGRRDYAGRIAIVMMMTLGIIPALCADEKAKWPGTVGKTGKQLPVWVVAGVKALLKEVPSLPSCPAG